MQTCLFLMMVFLQRCLHVSTREQGSTGSHAYYAVEIEGDSNVAMALAKQHGIDFIGKIGNMDGHYVFRDPLHLRSRKFLKKKLLQEPKLKWVEWQEFYYRYNRATFPIWSDGTNHELVKNEDKIESVISNVNNSKEISDDPLVFNDPYWPQQWELESFKQSENGI
ncbi:neuroendocrine convertase 1-like isoform X1 [Narcine bancroftii]|uniref:neuroendocrine convertase 1-like isoform X1 n=1 Tax=Narcine bancroftii TaxID=1343680 RepID=UPI0038317CB8